MGLANRILAIQLKHALTVDYPESLANLICKFKTLRSAVFDLKWAKSRDNYHRIASESYRCDSNR